MPGYWVIPRYNPACYQVTYQVMVARLYMLQVMSARLHNFHVITMLLGYLPGYRHQVTHFQGISQVLTKLQ